MFRIIFNDSFFINGKEIKLKSTCGIFNKPDRWRLLLVNSLGTEQCTVPKWSRKQINNIRTKQKTITHTSLKIVNENDFLIDELMFAVTIQCSHAFVDSITNTPRSVN